MRFFYYKTDEIDMNHYEGLVSVDELFLFVINIHISTC